MNRFPNVNLDSSFVQDKNQNSWESDSLGSPASTPPNSAAELIRMKYFGKYPFFDGEQYVMELEEEEEEVHVPEVKKKRYNVEKTRYLERAEIFFSTLIDGLNLEDFRNTFKNASHGDQDKLLRFLLLSSVPHNIIRYGLQVGGSRCTRIIIFKELKLENAVKFEKIVRDALYPPKTLPKPSYKRKLDFDDSDEDNEDNAAPFRPPDQLSKIFALFHLFVESIDSKLITGRPCKHRQIKFFPGKERMNFSTLFCQFIDWTETRILSDPECQNNRGSYLQKLRDVKLDHFTQLMRRDYPEIEMNYTNALACDACRSDQNKINVNRKQLTIEEFLYNSS